MVRGDGLDLESQAFSGTEPRCDLPEPGHRRTGHRIVTERSKEYWFVQWERRVLAE